MNRILFTIAVFLSFLPARADDDSKCDFSVGADFVSSYVWRGMMLSGPSAQPAMGLQVGGFSAGAWGSVEMTGFGYKEVDLMANYTIGNLTIGLFNYWVSWEGNYNYFDFSESTAHILEASLEYDFDPFPLTIGWNTIIAGDDKYLDKNGKAKRAFSTYLEAKYAFQIKEAHLEAAVGASPWKSSTLYTPYDDGGRTDRFAVINLSLMASKDVKISDKYSLGIFSQLIFNPAKEGAFFVFGIRF
jgi:hypothetical protein